MIIILGHSIIPHHHHSDHTSTCSHKHSEESNDFVCSWGSPLLSEPDSDDNSDYCSFATNDFRYSNQLTITLFLVKFIKLNIPLEDESPIKLFSDRTNITFSSIFLTVFTLRGPPVA